jgi:hypothetical protein
MAARRLLIVMLVLLGISTLAAALIPQSKLNDDSNTTTTTGSTTTQAQTTTASNPAPPPGYLPPTKITVGGKKLPVVSPVHVGDSLTLRVRSVVPMQVAIPAFGQLGFATPEAPAQFSLVATTPGTIGIVDAAHNRVVAQIRVVNPEKKPSKKAKRPARAEPGPA